MARVTIDFFRVHFTEPEYPGTFEEVLAEIDRRQGTERNVAIAAGWTHFHRLKVGTRALIGDLLRVQADQLPVAANLEGTVEELALEQDQGIAAVTYFYYRRTTRVLLMLRSAGGLTGPGFEHLIRELSGVTVELRPVPQLEVVKRMKKLSPVRSISFKLAGPDAAHHIRAGRGIAGLLELMGEYEADVVDITLSVDRRRESRLNRGHAVSLLEQLHRLGQQEGSEVKKAKVRGLDPEEERTVALDLLHGRMVERVDVPVGPNRRLHDESCLEALSKAYTRKSADLDEMYG